MSRSNLFTSLIIVLVVAISIALFAYGNPEDRFVRSDDGRVTVTGQWQSETAVEVQSIGEDRYTIAPTYPYSNESFFIEFLVDDLESIDVFRLNEEYDMWELVPSAAISGALVIEVDRLGTFALVDRPEMNAPAFVAQFDALLGMAPAETVGYELAVGVLEDGGEVWRRLELSQHGGCGGIVGRGNRYERSELEHEARVLVDDVETLVHFLFVGRWTVDESGCEKGSELQGVLY